MKLCPIKRQKKKGRKAPVLVVESREAAKRRHGGGCAACMAAKVALGRAAHITARGVEAVKEE